MIQKTIIDYLQAEYDSGMTQEEIAQRHNLKQPQIQKILSGDRSAAGFNVQTIDKMFPKAVIHLDGVTQNITNSGNANFAQTLSGNINQSRHGAASEDSGIIGKIMEKVLDHEEFNAEEKVKFMKFIKKIEDLQ